MLIISAGATITLPLIAKRQKMQKLQQESLNLKAAIELAADISLSTHSPTRIALDKTNRTYQLEVTDPQQKQNYIELNDPLGKKRHLPDDVIITDIQGSSRLGKYEYLIFDPAKKIEAKIELHAIGKTKTLFISGQNIEIK